MCYNTNVLSKTIEVCTVKTKNKKRRLMFQITAAVLPLFLLLAVIICQQLGEQLP